MYSGMTPSALNWQKKIKKFVNDELIPWEVHAEKNNGELPKDIEKKHRDIAISLGLPGMGISKASGGLGLSMFEQMIIWEQLGRVTNALSWCFSEAQDWMENNFNEYQKKAMAALKKQEKKQAEALEKLTKDATTTESGLKYIILQNGEGDTPYPGQSVRVHYSGSLVDGTQFDSSIGKVPIEFMLGARKVIPGWEEGIQLLNVGAKAKLIIPPALGWGSRGAGNVIPPNATVIFDVELIEILPENHNHDHSDPNHTH